VHHKLGPCSSGSLSASTTGFEAHAEHSTGLKHLVQTHQQLLALPRTAACSGPRLKVRVSGRSCLDWQQTGSVACLLALVLQRSACTADWQRGMFACAGAATHGMHSRHPVQVRQVIKVQFPTLLNLHDDELCMHCVTLTIAVTLILLCCPTTPSAEDLQEMMVSLLYWLHSFQECRQWLCLPITMGKPCAILPLCGLLQANLSDAQQNSTARSVRTLACLPQVAIMLFACS